MASKAKFGFCYEAVTNSTPIYTQISYAADWSVKARVRGGRPFQRARSQICGASLGSGGFLRRGAGGAERGALRSFSFDLSPIRPDEVTSRSLCSANFAELRIDSLCYEEPLLIPLEPTTHHGKPVSCELVSGDPHLV